MKIYRIAILITSFMFLSGFLPFASLFGPGVTIVSSGNVYKAGAQFVVDHHIKKKTGKNSLTLVTEEMKKSNDKKNLNEDLKKLVERRIAITHKELIKQNNHKKFNKELKMLIEKRIVAVQKKLDLNKITQ